MKKILSALIFALLLGFAAQATSAQALPAAIATGPFKSGHLQGIAIDHAHNHIYLSYTTMLIKTDMQGRIIGTVVGFLGHLGDLAFNPQDGRVYGTLEYKNDEIGRGILQQEQSKAQFANRFYIAIFDGERIVREGMRPDEESVMTSVHLHRVAEDYSATVTTAEGEKPHRLGCSGMDGLCFGTKFGKRGGKLLLTVAYGIYSDTKRSDNDHQVLLQYDVSKWHKYERTLTQSAASMHTSGPAQPDGEYFAYTGNTAYGVQNMEYDRERKIWWLAVYKGAKRDFPNYSLFALDGTAKPTKQPLKGVPYIASGKVVAPQQSIDCHRDTTSGVSGWHFPLGSTGFHHAGGDLFYIAQSYNTKEGQCSNLYLHRFTGNKESLFERVK